MSELTPLMKQYFNIKERYKDAIVFFRLGDFYEMFGEDALIASKVLQITLTTRDRDKEEPIPMCGVPYFTADTYISKLIKAGYKVALCEQLEEPSQAKGLVERDVVRVITAGTHIPEEPKENSYILAFFPMKNITGVALADIHVGEFTLYETDGEIEDEIERFQPKEILYPASLKEDLRFKDLLRDFYSTPCEDWYFDPREGEALLLRFFKVSSLEGFGIIGMEAAIAAAGALMNYLETTQKGVLNFKKLTPIHKREFLYMDASTIKNLELLRSMREETSGSLLWALDETLTPMGGRLLRRSITRPLLDLAEINTRLSIVESLVNSGEILELLRSYLRKVQDIERLSGKIVTGTANPRDLIALKNSLKTVPQLRKILSGFDEPEIKKLTNNISVPEEVVNLIERTIIDDPPQSIKEGGFIKNGFDPEIDRLRELQQNSREIITRMEAEEKARTGIQSLKIGYNRVFGYYIEVTKANLRQIPSDYERKQTLVNAERFITPKLKEYEARILGADEELKRLEEERFRDILEGLKPHTESIKALSETVAYLDMLSAFATVSRRYNYTKPVIDESTLIEITDGRHPVIERLQNRERFVPNNLFINTDTDRLLIITGPNMAGKSTYMRQNALIVIMAQIGCFVPAAQARIGLVDRIFTRIGASDILSKGQSTFMVEMLETANILNNATFRSLIILDEIGRGTSTFDGISIAWAVAEYLAKNIRARTLFATHYHELTELALTVDGVKNYNISVKEWGDEIIFLRKIDEGPADKSYGIQVARLAGLPSVVLDRAKEILSNLEKTELDESGLPRFAGTPTDGMRQLDLFGGAFHPVISELRQLDMSNLKPEEALKILRRLKQKSEK
ncbi:MAG: DNA mismatch repair protein MutS [Thermodesulfovibrionales bacterium]|nr:DNA mismatch repair protein MutS [Thermodesulfovibrionales bacterium]